MKNGKTFLARTYQTIIYIGMIITHLREPKVYQGEGISNEIYKILEEHNIHDTLLVVDNKLFEESFTADIIKALLDHNIKVAIFHNFAANPSTKNVLEGLSIYKENDCHSIIGLGGGSSIDIAKMIGACVTNNKKNLDDMKGLLKVVHKTPLLIAVPTTAGTGSECTAVAVITNDETHHKFTIEDPKLIPSVAILEPKLLVNLPSHFTSTTGMDALTHAIEAFINLFRTRKSNKNALEAIKLIYENLYESWSNPEDLIKRNNMQLAAYKAGVAFTNAYVGYAHALSHALSGQYNVPHGLANSLILPIVLKAYGNKIYERIAIIYDYIKMGPTDISKKEKTEKFINWIYEINHKMDIHFNFNEIIKDVDISSLVENAYHEAYPLYSCPKMFEREELASLYNQIRIENKE